MISDEYGLQATDEWFIGKAVEFLNVMAGDGIGACLPDGSVLEADELLMNYVDRRLGILPMSVPEYVRESWK